MASILGTWPDPVLVAGAIASARGQRQGPEWHACASAAARGIRDAVVPVCTRQGSMQTDPETGESVVTQPTIETLRFEPLNVAVSDVSIVAVQSNALDLPAMQAETARSLVEQFARDNNKLLVEGGPVSVRSDPCRMATIYTYYGTNADQTGNAVTTAGTSLTSLLYNITGQMQGFTNALTSAQTQFEQTANSISNLYFKWYDVTTSGSTSAVYTPNAYGGFGGALTSNPYVAPPETDAQRAARVAREEAWRAAENARRAKLYVVTQRADKLWLSHLTDAQRCTWADQKYVDVVAGSGRRYRITSGRSGNVYLLDQFGKSVRKYCAYANDPGGYLPDGDHWFTQMLALRYDETAFLRAANTWDLLQAGSPFVGQGVDADRDVAEAMAA